jgi:hypothetical protein
MFKFRALVKFFQNVIIQKVHVFLPVQIITIQLFEKLDAFARNDF